MKKTKRGALKARPKLILGCRPFDSKSCHYQILHQEPMPYPLAGDVAIGSWRRPFGDLKIAVADDGWGSRQSPVYDASHNLYWLRGTKCPASDRFLQVPIPIDRGIPEAVQALGGVTIHMDRFVNNENDANAVLDNAGYARASGTESCKCPWAPEPQIPTVVDPLIVKGESDLATTLARIKANVAEVKVRQEANVKLFKEARMIRAALAALKKIARK